jgi:hypothetical protein
MEWCHPKESSHGRRILYFLWIASVIAFALDFNQSIVFSHSKVTIGPTANPRFSDGFVFSDFRKMDHLGIREG